MVQLVVYEITSIFIIVAGVSCITIISKLLFSRNNYQLAQMENNEVISSYPSIEGKNFVKKFKTLLIITILDELLRSLPDFDRFNFEHYRNRDRGIFHHF